MKDKVLIMDTCILCVWLGIPYMDDCGADKNKWTIKRVQKKIDEEIKKGTKFVLPIATIIETGNHIAHAAGNKYPIVNAFADLIEQTIDEETPWIAFSRQTELLQGEKLRGLLSKWRSSAVTENQSMGDASIADVADEFLKMGNEVEIFTGDAGRKNYENKEVQKYRLQPRRRKGIK